MTFDIAIIGAGIVGAACAFRFANEGLKVAIIESKKVSAGSTSEGMGHLVVMDDSEAQFALTNYSQKLWNKSATRLPKTNEYENCGTIWIAANEDELQEIVRKKDFFEKRMVNAEILDEKSLREAEPNLRTGLIAGLLVKSDSVVYQPAVSQFFIESAKLSMAKVFLGKKAVKISADGIKLEDSTFIEAKKIIIANGIWANELFPEFPIKKRKGHLVITERYPNFVKHQLVELGYLKSAHQSECDSVAFNIQPRITGQILIGSSRQFDAEDKAIDYGILQRMMKHAFTFMPKLSDLAAVRIWTGFRPATLDNLPYIGQHPNFENVYLATGHEGLGITTSLGTAELIADEIFGRESKIDRKPYSPKRVLN